MKKQNYNNINASVMQMVEEGCYWDSTYARRVIKFIEKHCRQSKYPFYNKPLKLLTWQKKLIRNMLSWYKPDGTLAINKANIYVPKKNGKSCISSTLALATIVFRPGSLVLVLASDLTEAGNVFNEAANMAEMDSELNEILDVKRSAKEIYNEETHSTIKVLSGMPTGKSGQNWDVCIIDELSFHRQSTARLVWDQLQGSNATKPNSLRIVITTAGFTKEGNIGYEQYIRTKQILNSQIIDTTTLGCIFEVGEDEDWTDPVVQASANPSIGHTFSKDYLANEYKETINNPAKESEFRTLKLNQWVGRTGYITSHAWGKCYQPFNEEDLYGCDAFIGVDWARRYDLAASNVLVKKNDVLYLLPRIYTPNDLATKKAISDGVPYPLWAKSGYIYLTEGNVIDNAFLRSKIVEDLKNFKVKQIRYDNKGMEETRQILQDTINKMNLETELIEVDQGYAGLGAATVVFEKMVKDGKIIHPNNPCVNWCLQNVVLKSDVYGQLIPNKKKYTGRIDAVSSTLTALSGWLKHVDEPDIDYTPFIL